METRFVSVEVVIRTNSDCQEWIDWFEAQDNHVANISTEDHASFVYFAPLPSSDADSTIRRLCREIMQLPDEIRRHWKSADAREFFIGYHVGETPHCFIEHLQADTMALVHEQDASVRIALYPAPNTD
ncbi:MAG: hypothetical protein AAF483_29780 [Planctomycetota bacterium]